VDFTLSTNLQKFKTQSLHFWQKLGQKEKWIIAGSTLLLLISLIAWSVWLGSKPDYVPLFSKLEARDAGEIANKLKDMKIPYEIGDNGTTLLVQSKDVYKTRLQLATEGLPRGSVKGFEIFDKTNLTSTESQTKVQYLTALQGELTRTIEQLSEVEKARVHIVLPEDSLYKKNEKPATASVLLKLRPNAELSQEQMRGIVHLVASSVQGLKAENITVVDTFGNILYDPTENPVNPLSPKHTLTQLDLQKKVQMDLQNSAQSLLQQVLGPNKAAVRVSVELNFDQRTVDNKSFEPVVDDKGILRSSHETSETFKGRGNQAPGGVPGTTSNIPGYPTTDRSESNYEKKEAIRNYEISERNEHLTAAPGSIRRLTVAVLIDNNLSQVQVEGISKVVASAVGLNPGRGDVISVESIPFSTILSDAEKQAEEAQKKAQQQKIWIMAAIAALAAIGTGVYFYHRRKQREEAEAAEAAAAAEEAAELMAVGELEPEEAEKAEKLTIREDIERLAKQRPEEFAQLLRTWLSEE
jgi:flagellar M-ring protein FliF